MFSVFFTPKQNPILESPNNKLNARTRGKKRRRDITELFVQCQQCGTGESPEWRLGPNGPKTLCNACGLKYWRKIQKAKIPDSGNKRIRFIDQQFPKTTSTHVTSVRIPTSVAVDLKSSVTGQEAQDQAMSYQETISDQQCPPPAVTVGRMKIQFLVSEEEK